MIVTLDAIAAVLPLEELQLQPPGYNKQKVSKQINYRQTKKISRVHGSGLESGCLVRQMGWLIVWEL